MPYTEENSDLPSRREEIQQLCKHSLKVLEEKYCVWKIIGSESLGTKKTEFQSQHNTIKTAVYLLLIQVAIVIVFPFQNRLIPKTCLQIHTDFFH